MAIDIVPITGTEFRLAEGEWPLSADLRARVPVAWAEMVAANPHVWDGRILGFSPPVLGADGILRAEAREDAYSAFMTWRQAGFPDIGVVHVFGAALIRCSDGALIFGIMGGKTVNAGRVYPPGGSLEPRDVRADGMVDVDACIATELQEETGLRVSDAELGPLLAISDGPRLCISRVVRFEHSSDRLASDIREFLAAESDPELADVVICRSAEDGRRAGQLVPYAAAILDALSGGRLLL